MTTNYEINRIANHLFGNIGTPPSTYYIGLLLATPNLDGSNVVEVASTGNGYARLALANNKTALTQANNGQVMNTASLTFAPVATGASWGNISTVGIFDSLAGGNLLYWSTQTVTKSYDDGDIAFFDIGDIVWTVQNVI